MTVYEVLMYVYYYLCRLNVIHSVLRLWECNGEALLTFFNLRFSHILLNSASVPTYFVQPFHVLLDNLHFERNSYLETSKVFS